MTRVGLVRRLESGRAVNHLYAKDGLHGLVSAWRYGTAFVLTWEECPPGAVEDAALYTRDERHTFATAGDVLVFIEASGLSARDFRP